MQRRWARSVRTVSAGALALLAAQSLTPPTAAVDVGAAGPTDALATAETVAPPLLPNLVALKAGNLYVERTPEGRRLRFAAALGNAGKGPVEIRPNRNRPCPEGMHHATQILYRDVDGNGRYRRSIDTEVARRSAGCMLLHPLHEHWHFLAAARYVLYRKDSDEKIRVARRKASFCLLDTRRLPERYGTWNYPAVYRDCSRTSPQGISVGWVDVYGSYLPGQSLRLPANASNGLYCLKIVVDPSDALRESDDTDNTSLRALRLVGNRAVIRPSRRCL